MASKQQFCTSSDLKCPSAAFRFILSFWYFTNHFSSLYDSFSLFLPLSLSFCLILSLLFLSLSHDLLLYMLFLYFEFFWRCLSPSYSILFILLSFSVSVPILFLFLSLTCSFSFPVCLFLIHFDNKCFHKIEEIKATLRQQKPPKSLRQFFSKVVSAENIFCLLIKF